MNADHKLVDKFSRRTLIGLVFNVLQDVAHPTGFISENTLSAAH